MSDDTATDNPAAPPEGGAAPPFGTVPGGAWTATSYDRKPLPTDPTLSAQVNPPPVQASATPGMTAFSNLLGAVEHLLAGFGHLTQVIPAAAGLGAVLTGAKMRLEAAKTALAEMSATLGDVAAGDLPAAVSDGEGAIKAGADVFNPPHDHT